jgi:hypothetical protein
VVCPPGAMPQADTFDPFRVSRPRTTSKIGNDTEGGGRPEGVKRDSPGQRPGYRNLNNLISPAGAKH